MGGLKMRITTCEFGMRWISNYFYALAICSLASICCASAQDSPAGGFLRIVNAVGGGEQRLHVEVDGKSIHPDGCKSGGVTGGLWMLASGHRLKFSVAGARSATMMHDVKAGKTLVLIVYAEWLPGKQGSEGEWTIRVMELKAHQPAKGKALTVVSVSRWDRLKVELGQMDQSWSGLFLKSGDIERRPLDWPHGYVPIRLNGKRLASIPVASAANYFVILYDGFDGVVRALSFKDRVYGEPR